MQATLRVSRAGRSFLSACLTLATFALAAFASIAEAQQPSPVFRFYNTQTGTHFYTINQAERDIVLVRYSQFAYEGPAYYAFPQAQGDNLPVYRFYNTAKGTHFYTQSEAEKNFVLVTYPVFAFEGPAYYAPAAPGAGRVSLFRFFNTNTGAHFFTTNVAERDMVLQRWPFFAYEGAAYQVYSTGSSGTGNNLLPNAKLTVSPSAVTTVPAIVSLFAEASDPDGSVTRVEYYLGADKIGETTFAPHTMNFAVTTPGTFAFRAVAYDNVGSPGPSPVVNLSAGTQQQNALPKVTLSATPASMTAGGPVTLTAVATDDDGTIANVKFYEGNALLATVAQAPFVHVYTTSAAKLYRFRAVATDNLGGTAPSSEVGVSVGQIANVAPKVALTVSPGALAQPGLVSLSATASDDDGTVARVSFYVNGGKILDVATAPYIASYNTTSNAIYKFTAVATDDKGLSTTTADVNVSVGQNTNLAPKVSLDVSQTAISFPGTVTMTATASDDDGTITRVRFYQNGSLRSDVTTAPYTFSYTTTVPGIYKFRAVAIDNRGAQTSTAETDVASGNAQQLNKIPAVSLSLSQTLVMAPATLTLTVNASDTDGTIQRVQFYRNGQKIGEKLAAPFTFVDTISGNGQVAYHADATDNVGNTGTTLQQVVSALAPMPVAVTNDADTWRLLNQATFGASQAEAARVKSLGIAGWINDQFNKPVSGYPTSRYNKVQLNETADCTTRNPLGENYPSNSPQATCVRDHLSLSMMQRDFFTSGVYGADQLRQRVAWALSQIFVISAVEQDLSRAYVMARYQQIMFEEAFGNLETILKRITLSPAMGNWLDAVNNDKPNLTTGRVPNENYAREIMQLFSVGLVELKADGTPLTDALGQEIPTYDQDDIKQFARVFTGYTYARADGAAPTGKNGVFYNADMVVYPSTTTTGHDTDAKTLLNNMALPAGQTPQKDIDDAVRNVFLHANTGPFIAKQLIQRLVTGNPSPGYVQRVTQVFSNNGAGVRGDLKAVVRAILLDAEARGPAKTDPAFGTLREPALMIASLVRSLNGVTDGQALGDRSSTLGQRPYYAPTVFNYFQPDFMLPGDSVLAPEFAIYNSNSAVARTNLVYNLVYAGIAPDGNLAGARGTRLNTVQFEQYATDAAILTDKVSEMLLGGPLAATARTAVITAVNAIVLSATPTAQQRTDRARMAVYLIASSNHYQIQR